MLILRRRPARPDLRAVLRGLSERRMRLGPEGAVLPLPARPDLFIEIYLADPYRVAEADGAPQQTPSDVMVVGPHVRRRVALHLSGEVHALHLSLQPTALNRLFSVDGADLADGAVEARALIGPSAADLRRAVLAAGGFEARADAAERWIAERLVQAREADAVDRAARMLRRAGGRLPLSALAARAELGDRQWRRRFTTATGLAPKLYARVARLDAALTLRRTRADLGWSELAAAAGYFDQSHLLRDARELLGATPAGWLSGAMSVPS